MIWITLPLVGFVLVLFFVLKYRSLVAAKDAKEMLRGGALVIDVRTPGEFVSGHLPIAMNLPLNEIEFTVTRQVQKKDQPMLLQCDSGIRSGIAVKKLQALGYTKVYNLGSYPRATKIVNDR